MKVNQTERDAAFDDTNLAESAETNSTPVQIPFHGNRCFFYVGIQYQTTWVVPVDNKTY